MRISLGVHPEAPESGAGRGSALAATLREIEPGTRVRLVFRSGREVSGRFSGVSDSTIELDNGDTRIPVREVERLFMEFGARPHRRRGQAA